MAGPWCSQILADLGAEIIKIERPGLGDETRQWGPPWLKDKDNNKTDEGAYYLCTNRGKHSLTVDIARLHTAACHRNAEDFTPVVATGRRIHFGSSAKFGRNTNQRRI